MKTAELTDGLGKLAEVMETAEFRDLSALCRNAAEELLRRKEVVAVKHTKFYSSVTDISVFWDRELAKKSLKASLNRRLEMLRSLGYKPKVIVREDQYEVNANNGSIYYVGTLATQAGLIAVLADGMGKAYGARIASRTAVETFLDLFRDYNAFDNPQYYFRKSFHTANRAILRELGDEGYGAASVGAAMIQDSWLFYAVVGNVKLCVYRGGDLVPVSAGHTLDVLAEESFRTGRLSREDALVMLENHRLYNYLGQDGFQDVEIFDRPIKLQQGDIIVLMSDGLYELIPWKEIEEVLASGQDCQSMAYSMVLI